MTAVINNFGGFYHTWVYFNEAKQSGAQIELPDVNESEYYTTIKDTTIYMGFVHVKSLEEGVAKSIIRERKTNGPYRSFFDFIKRIGAGPEQLTILIRCGALRFAGKSKKNLMWEAVMFRKDPKKPKPHPRLFNEPVKKYAIPVFIDEQLENAYDEMELMGFPVTCSYFDLLKTTYRSDIFARDLLDHINRTVRILGNLVNVKWARTKKGEWMKFGCFLDQNGEFFDTINWPKTLAKWDFTAYGIYLIQGKVVEEFGFPSIEVEKMSRLPVKDDPRLAELSPAQRRKPIKDPSSRYH